MFPHGLPEEFTLIFTLALKKAALRDTVYLFQISDEQGYPQVQLALRFLISRFPASPFSHRHSFPCLTPSSALLSLSRSLTFCSARLLSTHPSRLSTLFCIVIHFPPRFIFSRDTFSILYLSLSFIPHVFCPLLFFVQSPPSRSLLVLPSLFPRSSSTLLVHSPSLLFMCVP